MRKDERLQIALTAEEKKELQELADINTGENMSLLLRRLIKLASANPEQFGLFSPKAGALAGSLN